MSWSRASCVCLGCLGEGLISFLEVCCRDLIFLGWEVMEFVWDWVWGR